MRFILWLSLLSILTFGYTTMLAEKDRANVQSVQNEIYICKILAQKLPNKKIFLDNLTKQLLVDAIEDDFFKDSPLTLQETLIACCDSLEKTDEVSLTDFLEIMPHLYNYLAQKAVRPDAENNNPIAGCCSCNSSQVLALLASIKSELLQCCEELQEDFRETWTILANLQITATVDLSGVYTSLEEILETLTTCCAQTETNFAGTFTMLEDILETLSVCCEELQEDFRETWTILATLTTTADLSGVYTSLTDIKNTLTTCCAELQEDFRETWTILANLQITATVDLSGVYTSLTDIKNTLTTCCAELQEDFRETWTILADIKQSNSTCCEELKEDFRETWTILANLTTTVDLSGVYTALAEVQETLTTCCAELQGALCDPILIDPAEVTVTTFTISSPGYYIVNGNINFSPASAQPAIAITSDNVTLNLCGNTITQGNGTANVDGIIVPGGVSNSSPRDNVTIQNGTVRNFTRMGIRIGFNPTSSPDRACSRITLTNLDIISCGSTGIEIEGQSSSIQIRGLIADYIRIIASGNTTSPVFRLAQARGAIVKNFAFNNNGGLGNLTVVAEITAVTTGLFENGNLSNNGSSLAAGLTVIDATDIVDFIFRGCTINTCSVSTGPFIGILINGASQNNVIAECNVTDNLATDSLSYAYDLESGINNTTVQAAFASDNTGNSESIGFRCNANTLSTFAQCVANDNVATTTALGFSIISSSDTVVSQCSARDNAGPGTSLHGGGIFATNAIRAVIENNFVARNNGTSSGIGIAITNTGGAGTLTSTVFTNQSADHTQNYVVSPGIILLVTFTKSTATLSATPSPLDNISIS